jgi:uncharacterized membrane protein
MNLHRIQLLLWAEQGHLDPECLPDALRLVRTSPAAADWRQFADRLLLALAVLSLASGVIFFFAYNWEILGHFSRFALAEGALILALCGVWRLGLTRPGGQASLFAAALCLGVLLALLGQTYQTGADVWELFAFWCALLLPWALLGRQTLLWLFWLALLNVALRLYLGDMPEEVLRGLDWLVFLAVNLLALSLGEGATRRGAEPNRRWALRLVALAAAVCATYGGIKGVWGKSSFGAWLSFRSTLENGMLLVGLGAWVLWAAGFWYVYRCRLRDFFMLALVAASFLLLAIVALTRALLLAHGDVEQKILLGGVSLIGMTLGVGVGLWRVYKNMAVEAQEKIAGEPA